jgi:hypothetical protein
MGGSKVCCECQSTSQLFPIKENDIETEEYVCLSCIKEGDSFGFCDYCGEEFAYPVSELNDYDECPDHKGESILSPEDQEGWEHNIRKWNEE